MSERPEDDHNHIDTPLSGIADNPHLHHVPRPMALLDIPNEVLQSIGSLYSATCLTVAKDDNRDSPLKTEPVQENCRSWMMLFIAFLFLTLYAIANFSLPVYFVKYMEVFGLGKAEGSWMSAIYVFSCFIIGKCTYIC